MYTIKNIQRIQRGENTPPRRYKGASKFFFGEKQAESAQAPEAAEVTAEVASEENIFFSSLAELGPKDIELNETAKNQKKPSVDFLRYFALLASLALLVYAGYNIIEQLYSYVREARGYDAIRSIMYEDDEGDLEAVQFLRKTKTNYPIQDILALQKHTGERVVQAEVSDGVGEVDKIKRNIKKLSDMSSDMFCWIKVQHTSIDYPVVQYTDNDYYLHHNFNKVWSSGGAIYADFNNSKNILDDRHLVIYGHNMLDNSMFQPLITAYEKREDNFRTGIIELITEDAMYYYEVFSVSEEDPWSGYIQTKFNSDEEYVEFLYSLKERSNFQKNVTLDADSKIITLSTCVNDIRLDRRFVVRGVLIDIK
ncbi:MAG: class B sortase [Oscillospiraceae bacterium]|nr:class B sortase [Oscillospiraceae bacterium]